MRPHVRSFFTPKIAYCAFYYLRYSQLMIIFYSPAYGTCAAAVRGFLRQYPDPAGSRNVQASCVRQPETFHQRGDQV